MTRPGGTDHAGSGAPEAWRPGPFVWLAGAAAAGVVVGDALVRPWAWLALGGGSAGVMFIMLARRRYRGARTWGWLAALALTAAWAALRLHHVPPNHVARLVSDESQLIEVVGRVEDRPYVSPAQRGTFGDLSYKPPATLFVLQLESMRRGDGEEPLAGKLLVKITRVDLDVRTGDRIAATGWLSAIEPPANPGELDYRNMLASRGIDGRLTLHEPGNRTVLERGADGHWGRLRRAASDAAAESLHLGLPGDPRRVAFLDALLLGRRGGDLGDLDESFRRVGLQHILTISGAHLGILAMLVWLLARLVVPDPPRAAAVVLAVLLLYLIALPAEVPILRSGLMAGLVCVGVISGRRFAVIEMLGLAAVICLLWRPGDLFTAGFQLSFGVTAALLLFTRPVSRWIVPEPLTMTHYDRTGAWLKRRGADLLAANLVGFGVSLPVVAHHFGMVSPLAIVLSILAFPVVTALLGVGYAKILLGLLLPSAGLVLAGPTAWLADAMAGLALHAATWPGSAFELSRPPGVAWTLGVVAVVIAAFSGMFAGRRRTGAAACAVAGLWLLAPAGAERWADVFQRPAPLTLHMFSVGDGSCYLVKMKHAKPQAGEEREHVLMFDCGSSAYLDLAGQSIVPSLRRMGVSRIDTLVVSHADLDHYCGVPGVIERVEVGRVLVPPQLLAAAEADDAGPVARLIDSIRQRGVPVEPVARGWGETHAGCELSMLWPPADYRPLRSNDTSLVLSIRPTAVAGRRVLLNGDIQQASISGLIESGDDLRADAADLPHHGSFVESSPAWLAAVSPSFVLQSSGPARLRDDRWAGVLRDKPVTRLVSDELGMVTLTIENDGRLAWRSFKAAPPR